MGGIPGSGSAIQEKTPLQRVDIDQRGIHHGFAGSRTDPADCRIRSLSAFGCGFNGGKVHVMPVAVSKEEDIGVPSAFFEPEAVLTEKFA